MIPIVVFGVSAGGLEAICELLAALPPESSLAYVLVQHLDPGHESLLPEILATKTAMAVRQIRDGMSVEASHVYVIPPNATLTLLEGCFRLMPRRTGAVPSLPINTFFASVAEEQSTAPVAVILSGGHSDGSLGIAAVKRRGGTTFAQTPESAKFPSMPQSAIATGCVDFVLTPGGIAKSLTHLRAQPPVVSVEAPETATNAMLEVLATADEASLASVFRVLRSAHGVDFSLYKRNTLRRRLARRMAAQRADTLSDYLVALEADPAESVASYRDFLIQVTGFFRDPDSFHGLAARVFPALSAGRSPKTPIRIWVPGCSTGRAGWS